MPTPNSQESRNQQLNRPRSEKRPSQPQRDGREPDKVPDRGALLAPVAAKVPEDGLCGVRGTGRDVRVGVDLAGDDCVDVGEADVVAVEAVCLVDDPEALVVGLNECDVDALRVFLVSQMVLGFPILSQPGKELLTENSDAPCTASSTTWMVALSPGETVVLAGRGTWGRHTVPG